MKSKVQEERYFTSRSLYHVVIGKFTKEEEAPLNYSASDSSLNAIFGRSFFLFISRGKTSAVESVNIIFLITNLPCSNNALLLILILMFERKRIAHQSAKLLELQGDANVHGPGPVHVFLSLIFEFFSHFSAC